MMKKWKLNLGAMITLSAMTYAVYYLLIYDNFLNISISSIIAYSHQLTIRAHLLVLGLLPIYIAAMIFGAGILGFYLGGALQQLFVRTSSKINSKN